jgi:hypothetical protein
VGVDRVGGEPGHDQRHAPLVPPGKEAKVMTGKTSPEHGPLKEPRIRREIAVLDTQQRASM